MLGKIMFYLPLIVPIMILGMIVVTEMLLLKEIKKSDKDDSIWLAINIILPILGYVLYKLSHKNSKEEIQK